MGCSRLEERMNSGISVSPIAPEGAAMPPAVSPKRELPLPAILFFLALVILLFLPVLAPLVNQWATDENMGYGFFVPLVAGYVFWLDRERILATPVKPCWPALALVAWGFCQMLVGFLGALSVVSRTAFVVTVVGVIWTVCGTAVMRVVKFPVLMLLFMFPMPLYLYQRLTLPLQSLATNVAAWGLAAIGIPVLQNGNVLDLGDHQLDVVEACSGIRSLLSLTFLAIAYGRLFETRTWVRIVLLVSTVPIAIVCNAARIILTGILTQYKPEIAEGTFHTFEGWVIFMFEMGVLLMFHRLLYRFGRRSHA
jgi:exosortase